MAVVELHRTHAAPIAAGHPWVFAQAVARVTGNPGDGDEVVVTDPTGRALGRGLYSPGSAIVVRIATRQADEPLDEPFFVRRVAAARALRALVDLPRSDTTGYRLMHAEGDGVPGLIVDAYGDTIVVQLLTAGMVQRRAHVVAALVQALSPRAIVLANSGRGGDAASLAEGEFLYGAPVERFQFVERGLRFDLPALGTQKTGYYFDQREHRAEVERLAAERDVLDGCTYVGGFALAAARGGARSVLALDTSAPALAIASELARDNGLSQIDYQRGDVRERFEQLAREGRRFDLVVLDPPKLVPTVKHLERGRRAYRKLNAQAMRLVTPGGMLVTCSCSAALGETDFLRMLAFAAGDAKRDLAVLRVGKQGPDHPLLPGFGEGAYLKTAFVVVR
jgi:23S rRNA (cytosine1962-C5)-methyltransferase